MHKITRTFTNRRIPGKAGGYLYIHMCKLRSHTYVYIHAYNTHLNNAGHTDKIHAFLASFRARHTEPDIHT